VYAFTANVFRPAARASLPESQHRSEVINNLESPAHVISDPPLVRWQPSAWPFDFQPSALKSWKSAPSRRVPILASFPAVAAVRNSPAENVSNASHWHSGRSATADQERMWPWGRQDSRRFTRDAGNSISSATRSLAQGFCGS